MASPEVRQLVARLSVVFQPTDKIGDVLVVLGSLWCGYALMAFQAHPEALPSMKKMLDKMRLLVESFEQGEIAPPTGGNGERTIH